MTNEQAEQAFRRQWVDGLTGRAVAKELGATPMNVSRWAKKYMKEQPDAARAMIKAAGRPMPPWLARPEDRTMTPTVANHVMRTDRAVDVPAGSFLGRVASLATGAAPAAKSEPPPSPEEPEAPGPIGGDSLDQTIGWLRKCATNVERLIERADQLKDGESAAKLARTLSNMLPGIIRLEQLRKQSGDMLSFSMADIDAACESVVEKYLHVPTDRCAHCGRAMRIEQSGANADEIDAPDEA